MSGKGQEVFEAAFSDFNYNLTMEEVIQGRGPIEGEQCTYEAAMPGMGGVWLSYVLHN